MGYREEVLADNPLIHLRLGETSGTFVNGGSLGGTADRTRLTPTGGIAGSDGASTFGTAPSFARVANVSSSHWDGSFTVELWFKGLTQNDKTLAWFTNGPYWYMCIDSAGKLAFVADDYQSPGIRIQTSGSVLNINSWQHAVAVVGEGKVTLYLNGTQVAQVTATPGFFNNVAAVEVGDSRTSFSPTAGSVDEFAVYPTALSLARIQAHYNTGLALPVPISVNSGLAGELLLENLAGATVDLFSPSVSFDAGIAGSLDLRSLFGPEVELGPMPPKELLTGISGNISLLGTNSPRLGKASYAGQAGILNGFGLDIDKPEISNIATKVVYAGQMQGFVRLLGMSNGPTVAKAAPQVFGYWYMQTIMADAKFDVTHQSQNIGARMPRKRTKTHLANLVKN